VTVELLARNFDRVTATTESIALLRGFALAVAVSGRLVESHLPSAAATSRLGDYASLQNGYAFKSEWFVDEGMPLLRNVNIGHGDIEWQSRASIPNAMADQFARFRLRSGDIVLSLDRPFIATGIKVARVGDGDLPSLLLQRVGRFQVDEQRLDPAYLFLWLRSPPFIQQIDPGRSNGVPHVSSKQVEAARLRIPSLIEQHRIVAKVDELMALCDELEAAQANREARRDLLRTTSLRNLVTHDGSKDHARFFLQNASRMITKPEHVAGVRQVVVDLAVCGRLVPQDPGDQPAIELIRAILKRRGGRSATPPPTPVMQDWLPESWQATTLATACISVTDGDHQPPPKTATGIPFLVISDVRLGKIDYRGSRYVSENYYKRLDAFHRPGMGDVLYTLVGSYGIPVPVTSGDPFCVQRHIGILRPEPEVLQSYLTVALGSSCSFQQATDCATGIAQKTVPLRGLRRLVISLPPLAEQRRIVAKVDELIAVCNELEQSLAAEQTERSRVLEALLHDALGDALQRASSNS
jgi:type I restriction enzyme, S subunit